MKVLWYLEFITDANIVILKQVNGGIAWQSNG